MKQTHDALMFAIDRHGDQTRKDGKTPYFTHPIGVALLVARYGGDDNQIRIAKLHDVVEDCDVTIDEIREIFGDDVANGVDALTNTSKQIAPELNRAQRKALDNKRLASILKRYKMVKLCDILYNVSDLDGLDKGFALKFLEEKRQQSRVVADGNLQIYYEIQEMIEQQIAKLEKR